MTKLSVNINKIATLRNSRGGNYPDVLSFAKKIQEFGAAGITIHPRPDERHIKYADAFALKEVVYTEFNIEGNPTEKFINLVNAIKPTQVTLVPDAVDAITSNAGWDTITNKNMLKEIVSEFKSNNIRTSIFLDPDIKYLDSVCEIGPDRIELYTEQFAKEYAKNNLDVIGSYSKCASEISKSGIGINAGHDLSLKNIKFFKENINDLAEVSIGHSLVVESLFLGLENTISKYLRLLS
jgi:pyridoxine 5-phosphate synthase